MIATGFDLSAFIREKVTGRAQPLTAADMTRHGETLRQRIEHKSALVLGGAGTIGSHFIKTLLKFNPARLYVVDTNENALTELVRDLRSAANLTLPAELITYPFDFGQPVFEKMLRSKGPFDIVANFAAHKHVRSEKDAFAIEAMLENNVFKTRNLLQQLSARPPERFFCVSTDKAAEPVNVMGASKRLMEQILMAYAERIPVVTARFANVAFSNGSLPAGFLARLSKGQPLSAPLDVRRYFVSPEEAGQICLLACMLGESGDILFPKLDVLSDQRSFTDIACDLLRAIGLEARVCGSEQEARERAANPEPGQYPVYFFRSDTDGEKMEEQFWSAPETPDWSRFEALGVVRYAQKPSAGDIENCLAELQGLFRQDYPDKARIIALLERHVSGFKHRASGLNLDAKM